MADPKNTNPAASKPKTAADLFKAFDGDEIFANRPIIKFTELKDQALPVQGWLISRDTLRLPLGADRIKKAKNPDGTTTDVKVDNWIAYAVLLTAPTNALDDKGNVYTVIAGREVYVAENPNNAERLNGRLGFEHMFEVCIVGGDDMKMQGRNAMHTFDIKVGKATKKREGAFIVGGPSNNVTRQLTEGMSSITDALAGIGVNGQAQRQEVAAP